MMRTIAKVKVYFNEKSSRQLRKCQKEVFLGVQSGRNSITVYSQLNSDNLSKIAELDDVKGSYIADFRFCGKRSLVTISENGFLSLATFRRNHFQVDDNLRLKWYEGDQIYALRVDNYNQYAVVLSGNGIKNNSIHITQINFKEEKKTLKFIEKRLFIFSEDFSLALTTLPDTSKHYLMPEDLTFFVYDLNGARGYSIMNLERENFVLKKIGNREKLSSQPTTLKTELDKIKGLDSDGNIVIITKK